MKTLVRLLTGSLLLLFFTSCTLTAVQRDTLHPSSAGFLRTSIISTYPVMYPSFNRTAGLTSIPAVFHPTHHSAAAVPVNASESEVSSLSPVQTKLLEGARSLLGKTRLVVNGRNYNYDCTGTVLAVYAHAGIDLARDFHKYSGNGVNRLYRTMETGDFLYNTRYPVPGDLIFWDNTYDKNSDGRWNDPLTHVGMVTDTMEDGLISYIHLNYRRGITIEYMNLEEPEVNRISLDGRTREVNSPMRMRSQRAGQPDKWLAGQLYNSFGKAYLF